MLDFSGKSVLVSGGTSGIGQAIADAFSVAGARVVAAGLVADTDLQAPIRAEIFDVTDDDAVQNLIADIPVLDVLVNAAGIIRRDTEFELKTFAEVLDVNLTGAMRVCRASHSKLVASKGCIINIATVHFHQGDNAERILVDYNDGKAVCAIGVSQEAPFKQRDVKNFEYAAFTS